MRSTALDGAGAAPRRDDAVDLVLVGTAAVAVLLVSGDVDGPVRAVAVAVAALLLPGRALLRCLPHHAVAERWSLAVAASLALHVLVATVMGRAGAWSPSLALTVTAGLSAVVVWRDVTRRRGRAGEAPRMPST